MLMRTQDLKGKALDWAVAKCEKPEWLGNQAEIYVTDCGYSPSTNWEQGGPIIEREIGCLFFDGEEWRASGEDIDIYGPTPLIAAIRCYVASKLGDTVDIPDEIA